MPNIVMLDERLSFQARFLYQLMLMFSWLKGNCFPGQDRLAQIMKVHRNSVLRYLQEFFKKFSEGCRDYAHMVPGKLALD